MVTIGKDSYLDKVHGCWIGKSIGGTLGAPFEGRKELLEVTGFSSPPGRSLPNDDLDLQLIWLKSLEDHGPLGISENVLGEYWINYIPPQWNEYGIAKSNMKAGIQPPLSGEYQNPWKHSNGAWIRSEIWACCAPGCPEIALRYAWMDACVDHGVGEGTNAELFTAAIESAAFVQADRDTLISIGLSWIPSDCRVARSIGIARDCHAKGLDWKEARRRVLEDSADLGWFQAPANVAFTMIGWLYGGGDFKKSLLLAVSCGDDTDCTGATLGALLGILEGARALPDDWKKHVGDEIATIAIDRGSWWNIPATCSELTDRVARMAPQVLAAHRAPVFIDEKHVDTTSRGIDELSASPAHLERLASGTAALRFDFIHTEVRLEYPDGIAIRAGQETSLRLTLHNVFPDPRHVEITYLLPEGFVLLDGCRSFSLLHFQTRCLTVRLRAGDSVQAANRGVIQIVSVDRPTVILVPILFRGEWIS